MTGDDSVCGRSGRAFTCLGASPVTRQAIYGSTVRVSRVSSEEEEREEQVWRIESQQHRGLGGSLPSPKVARGERVECNGSTFCRCSKSGFGR